MKNLLIIGILALVFSSVFGQDDKLPAFTDEVEYVGERVLYKNIPFTGILVDRKSKKKLGEYKNGYRSGLFTEYYLNGNTKTTCNYVEGKKSGVYREWYENGSLFKEILYKLDKIVDGDYISFNENGTKSILEKYVNGKLTKTQRYKGDDLYEKVIEYYPNGPKKAEGWTKNGQRDSIWTEYFITGEKNQVTNYINGFVDEVIFKSKIDPSISIKYHNRKDMDIFMLIREFEKDTIFFQVSIDFKIELKTGDSRPYEEEFKRCFISALEPFHKMSEYEKNQNANKPILFKIIFSHLAFTVEPVRNIIPTTFNYDCAIGIAMQIFNFKTNERLLFRKPLQRQYIRYPKYKDQIDAFYGLPLLIKDDVIQAIKSTIK
jgi:antitoxin component YwqK of YwqJK toxin-antitoxin module